MTDAELGAALRRAGLTPRAVAAAWGRATARSLAGPLARLPATPATAVLRLLVAGEVVERPHVERGLGATATAALAARGLLAAPSTPAAVRARWRVLPIGPSLVVCDAATWPDDSSDHLVGCLPPGKVARWLDVGTGCGLAPLARPERATAILATDVDPDAIAAAALGVALSGVRHVDVARADLLAGAPGGLELVTFNLPIPAEAGLTRDGEAAFRHAPPGADLFARFARDVGAHLAPDATVIVHSWLGPPIAGLLAALPGDVAVVRYTPDDSAPFGVVRWRPGAPPAHRALRRLATAAAPHLAWDDLEAASALAPH